MRLLRVVAAIEQVGREKAQNTPSEGLSRKARKFGKALSCLWCVSWWPPSVSIRVHPWLPPREVVGKRRPPLRAHSHPPFPDLTPRGPGPSSEASSQGVRANGQAARRRLRAEMS